MTGRTDFLIIGGGIAGLRAAVHLGTIGRVHLLTKAYPDDSNTGWAQGGIAAAVGPDDSPDLHFRDTMAAGDGLCVPDAVRVLVDEGPRLVYELIAWGARVDRDRAGAIALAREAAHSVRRVLHAADATGRELSRVLWARASELQSLEVHDHAQAVALLVEDGCCVGAGTQLVRAKTLRNGSYELLFQREGGIFSIDFTPGPSARVSEPRRHRLDPHALGIRYWDTLPDGRLVVVAGPDTEQGANELRLVLNWTQLLD